MSRFRSAFRFHRSTAKSTDKVNRSENRGLFPSYGGRLLCEPLEDRRMLSATGGENALRAIRDVNGPLCGEPGTVGG